MPKKRKQVALTVDAPAGSLLANGDSGCAPSPASPPSFSPRPVCLCPTLVVLGILTATVVVSRQDGAADVEPVRHAKQRAGGAGQVEFVRHAARKRAGGVGQGEPVRLAQKRAGGIGQGAGSSSRR